MDMGAMMKAMAAWNTFKKNHPKFPAFCKAAAQKGLRENSIVSITITTPEGEKIETNLKVQASDLELLKGLGSISQ